MADLGTLVVKVNGDLSGLDNELKKGGKSIDDFANKGAAAAPKFTGFTSAATLAVSKLDLSIKTSAKSLDEFAGKSENVIKSFSGNTNKATLAIKPLIDKIKESGQGLDTFGEKGTASVGKFSGLAGKAVSSLAPLIGGLVGLGAAAAIGFAVELIIKYVAKLREASDAIKQLVQNQKYINEISAEANKNASTEITTLKILYEQTQNVSASIKDRSKAALELQKTYPETFASFSTEQILLGNAKSGYDSLTASILRQALAKASLGKLSDIAAQKLDIEFQKAKIIAKTNQEIDAVKKPIFVSSGSSSGGSSMTGGSGVSNDVIITTEEQKIKVTNRRTEALKPLIQQLKNLGQSEKFITDFIGAANLVDAAMSKPLEVKKLKIKANKVELEQIDDIELKAERRTGATKLDDGTFGTTVTNKFKGIKVALDTEFYKQSLDDISGLTQKRTDEINGIIKSTTSNIVGGFAEAIGKGLGGGNIDGLFSGLLKSLAGGIKQLGQSLVQTYLLVALVKKVKFSNPVAGIAAGLALIALGSFIDAKLSKTPAFANGVNNFRGGVALVGERGPELVNLPKGADVIPNNQLGGNIGGGASDVNVTGQFVVRGSELVAVINRANQTISRNS